MKATDILSSEHRVIESVIGAIETAAQAAEADKTVRPAFFSDAADFIKGFADGCHHRKEENVLFTTMGSYGVPVDGGPIGVMLAEHEQGRQFTRNMRAGAELWQTGEVSGRAQTVAAAKGYAALLRQHIFKEDNILFPMADRFIPASEYEEVYEAFERVEHEETGEGVHEKYLAIANALQIEAESYA